MTADDIGGLSGFRRPPRIENESTGQLLEDIALPRSPKADEDPNFRFAYNWSGMINSWIQLFEFVTRYIRDIFRHSHRF